MTKTNSEYLGSLRVVRSQRAAAVTHLAAVSGFSLVGCTLRASGDVVSIWESLQAAIASADAAGDIVGGDALAALSGRLLRIAQP